MMKDTGENGWVYRETRGNELEKLTSQGWEYVDSHVSKHDYVGYCFGHLVRRPRVKQTELELREEIERLEKDVTERQARARSRAASVSSQTDDAIRLLTCTHDRLEQVVDDKTKSERLRRVNTAKHELARVIELLKGMSPPLPEEGRPTDAVQTCARHPR